MLLGAYKGTVRRRPDDIREPALGSPFWSGNGGAEALRAGPVRGAGVTELWLKPNYGSYEPGERPVFMLQGQQVLQTRTERVSSGTGLVIQASHT